MEGEEGGLDNRARAGMANQPFKVEMARLADLGRGPLDSSQGHILPSNYIHNLLRVGRNEEIKKGQNQ